MVNIFELLLLFTNFWINENIEQRPLRYTEPGTWMHYLFPGLSQNSICVKLGKFGEDFTKEIIKETENFELLPCGIKKFVDNTKKDIDLFFKYIKKKIIYYYELKSNINLDSEKLPATVNKCEEIKKHLKNEYKDYKIVYGILNWMEYDKKNLNKKKKNLVKKYTNKNIVIYYFSDFMNQLNIKTFTKKHYDKIFKNIKDKVTKIYNEKKKEYYLSNDIQLSVEELIEKCKLLGTEDKQKLSNELVKMI